MANTPVTDNNMFQIDNNLNNFLFSFVDKVFIVAEIFELFRVS